MWFKVDDKLAFHPKVMMAGNPALGLWVRAGSYVAAHLTDGYVPADVARALGTPIQIRQLVDSGLWLPCGNGYEFHGWTEWQPTRDQVEAERDWNKRRAELHRDSTLIAAIRKRDEDRCRYCGIGVNFKARRGPTAGTYDHVIPRGPNTLENVVVACGPCNTRKHNRTPDQAGMSLLDPGSMGGNYP